jgi:hypothetical protein
LRVLKIINNDAELEYRDKFKQTHEEKGVHLEVGDNEGNSTNFFMITSDKDDLESVNNGEIFILNGETVDSNFYFFYINFFK